MRTLLTRSAGVLPLLLLLAVAAAPKASAQRLGLEAGLAGVENYDPVTPSIALSLFVPLTDRFRAVGSFSRWVGCDGDDGCGETGYGNSGFNLLGLYRILGSSAASASVGAGVAWYEMHRLRDGERVTRHDEAITFSTELRRAVSYNSSVYVRGDLSFPDEEAQPRWGFVRIGVDVGGVN